VLHEELVEVGSAMVELCVKSITELKALNAGAVPCLTVLGYYAPGDGGGGGFYWDPSGMEADNGGRRAAPTPSPSVRSIQFRGYPSSRFAQCRSRKSSRRLKHRLILSSRRI
jgi:hypothetical protein